MAVLTLTNNRPEASAQDLQVSAQVMQDVYLCREPRDVYRAKYQAMARDQLDAALSQLEDVRHSLGKHVHALIVSWLVCNAWLEPPSSIG